MNETTITQTQRTEQDEFAPYELVVDPETGEILEDANVITSTDLPRVARAISAIDSEITHKADVIQREINRLTEILSHKTAQLNARKEFMLQRAERIVAASGARKHELPGIGTFKFVKGREHVDDGEYYAASDDDRANMQIKMKDLFAIKTTVSPDKRKIKEVLKSGAAVPGFAIAVKPDTFKFDSEV